jgi:hypothetical protein
MVRQISKLAPSLRTILLAAVASVPLFASNASAATPDRNVFVPMQPAATPAAAGPCSLQYNGGPVISQVQAVGVLWGQVSNNVKTAMPGLLKSIVASPYIDALSEYNTDKISGGSGQKIVRGTYVDTIQITPKVVTSTTFDDGQIGSELQAQIDAGVLPQPTFDKAGHTNTLFVIFFAPGITITMGTGSNQATSCVDFCGYHAGYMGTNGKPILYASVPDLSTGPCTKGCGNPELAALGTTVSHEMAESITDPMAFTNDTSQLAWYDTAEQPPAGQQARCGEVGDICAPGTGADPSAGTGTLGNYTVQKEWSNQNSTCEVTNSSIGPQGGCTKNSDCAAPTAVCNTGASSCVGCLTNSDCSGNTPVCDTKSNTCKACSGNNDCSGSTPICITGDAGSNAGKCVACSTNTDCPSSAPVCKSNACTGCTSNSDCSSPNVCNTGSGACGPASTGGSSGGSSGSSGGGGNGGGNGDNGGTGSSGGCAVSDGPASSAFGFAGILFGLAAVARAKRSRAARR